MPWAPMALGVEVEHLRITDVADLHEKEGSEQPTTVLQLSHAVHPCCLF